MNKNVKGGKCPDCGGKITHTIKDCLKMREDNLYFLKNQRRKEKGLV